MGPLEGIQLLEIAGIGPGPFAAMLLADPRFGVHLRDRGSTRLRRSATGESPGNASPGWRRRKRSPSMPPPTESHRRAGGSGTPTPPGRDTSPPW